LENLRNEQRIDEQRIDPALCPTESGKPWTVINDVATYEVVVDLSDA